jgi:hypothetical protein
MIRLILALTLFAAPALAQTPNLSAGPPLEGVPNPVVCLPIGKTANGIFVYPMDCRDIQASTGTKRAVQDALSNLPGEKAAVAPGKN